MVASILILSTVDGVTVAHTQSPALLDFLGHGVLEKPNPGPKDVLIVTSTNLTSIPKRTDDLNSITKDTHVCLVQDAGLTPSNVNLVRDDLKDRGWRRLLSGPISTPHQRQAQQGQRPYRERGNHASGGVAILSRGVVVTPWALPPEPLRNEAFDILIQSKRWMPAIISVGGMNIFVHNLYLPTRAKQDRDTLAYSNDLIRAVFLVASGHGDAPVLIGGDFNLDPSHSDVLKRVEASQLWTDAW